MSQVYLTKIERKTIFTKSLIYVLVMFLVSDLTVTGPFWFNFIPWLYIVSAIGSVKGIDKVLTCIIGMFTVFVSSVILQGALNLQCIIIVIIAGIELVSGIVTGHLIYQFILEHRLVKYLKKSRKAIAIVVIVLCTVISFGMLAIFEGNIFEYLKAKTNLQEYVEKTYEIKEYKIERVIFNKNYPGKYSFVLKVDDVQAYFVPVTSTMFKDNNKQERLELLNDKLKKETSEKIYDILQLVHEVKDAEVCLKYNYTKIGIPPDSLTLCISLEASEEKMIAVYKQLVTLIKDITEVYNIDECIVTINNISLRITKDNLQDISVDYLKGGFEIEELDELGG